LYWEDVDEQLADEALNKMMKAKEVSDEFNAQTGEQTTWETTLPFIQSLNPNPPNPGEVPQQTGDKEN